MKPRSENEAKQRIRPQPKPRKVASSALKALASWHIPVTRQGPLLRREAEGCAHGTLATKLPKHADPLKLNVPVSWSTAPEPCDSIQNRMSCPASTSAAFHRSTTSDCCCCGNCAWTVEMRELCWAFRRLGVGLMGLWLKTFWAFQHSRHLKGERDAKERTSTASTRLRWGRVLARLGGTTRVFWRLGSGLRSQGTCTGCCCWPCHTAQANKRPSFLQPNRA